MLNLYVVAGCEGAGKTTASFTVLPEMLDCEEFINADEIARGLSPLKPEKAALEAGRIMLSKIKKLILNQIDFAFETTLATKSYTGMIRNAKQMGFQVTLIFLYLDSHELAIKRVKARVIEGGHDIPNGIITRRYYSGLRNLFNLYIPITDFWMIFDNSRLHSELIVEGYTDQEIHIKNIRKFDVIKGKAQDDSKR